jgi:hypothetical protein
MANDYHVNDEIVYANQIENMWRALKGWKVISGLAVTESSPQARTVDVASGVCWVNDTYVNKASSTDDIAVAAADSTKKRMDHVEINSSGTISVVTGNLESAAGAGNHYPAVLGNNAILLALIEVGAGATIIYNADLTDKRIIEDVSNGKRDVNMVEVEVIDASQTDNDTGTMVEAASTAINLNTTYGWSSYLILGVYLQCDVQQDSGNDLEVQVTFGGVTLGLWHYDNSSWSTKTETYSEKDPSPGGSITRGFLPHWSNTTNTSLDVDMRKATSPGPARIKNITARCYLLKID